MRRFSILLLLLTTCKGGGEAPGPHAVREPGTSVTLRSGSVLRIEPPCDPAGDTADFVPPEITLAGVSEDSVSVTLWVTDYDVEVAQAATIGDPIVRTVRYVADSAGIRGQFTEEWRQVMSQLEGNASAHPSVLDSGGTPRTWRRSGLAPNATRLSVGDREELPLRSMKATVRICGFRARVLLDCVYENDRDRQLEGDFQLRLPEGAAPFRLAFAATAPAEPTEGKHAWAAPKEARFVPREKASRAYGEVVRRQVDPALLEWSGAGVFSARVFPLEPGKLHRVVVGYDLDLLPQGEDLVYRLDLPERVPDLRVDITVAGLAHTIDPPAPGGERHVYENPEARSFAVRITEPGDLVLHGRDAAAGDLFAALVRPDLDAEPAAPTRRATFLVDLSASSDPAIWLTLLEAILDRNRATLENFSVLFFNIEAFWWRDGPAANTPENVRALLEDARALTCEGATDLGLALETAANRPEGDLFLLSDGHATWGESDRHALARCVEGRTLYAYTTCLAGTDGDTLALLARESGGAVFAVAGESEIPAAATAHTARPWHLEEMRMEGASDVLLAGRPTAIFPGQTLRLAGRGRPPGPLDITLRRDAERRTVRIPLRALDGDLAAGAYARIAVSQLEEARAPEARSFALHFGVVGETCSLLMLETEDDYKRYGIAPEGDARVVGEEASALVARALESKGLGDPKARFLAWLGRLDLPADVREAAARLPVEAFDVRPEPLRCRCRDGAAQRDYDAAAAEAARRGGAADALKAMSSLVEESPGDWALARDIGYGAMEGGLGGQAYHLFRRVAEARPHEPLTYRAMALCLADLGKRDLALLCHEIARAGSWEGRFGDLGLVLEVEYLRFLREHAERCVDNDLALRRLGELAEGAGPRVADLLVVIEWSTDRTDVDLHVVDPRGEECYYNHHETAIGGRLTRDVTQGYGPEMFLLERAVPGPYLVRAKYFSSDRNRASARTRVYATMYEDWGRPEERATRKVLTLSEANEMHDIATMERR